MLDLARRDDNFAGVTTGALVHQIGGEKQSSPQDEEVHERFAQKLGEHRLTARLFLRRVPNGRGVGALLLDHRNLRIHRHSEFNGVIKRPARSRYFQNADVIECFERGVEVWIFPVAVNSGAPIVLVYVAVFISTVSPTAGNLPSAPGLRLPDQATS